MVDENKEKVVSIRMSETQYREVSEQAKSANRSLSEHIRRKVADQDRLSYTSQE